MDVGQPELALGTVQLGLPYGIAGRGVRVSDDEARSILAAAHERGVRMLDTAAAYGDIEERLVGLFPPGRAFEVTSKIAPLPQEYTKVGADERALAAHVVACIDRSAQRLQGHLKTLLFHRAEDLDSPAGGMIWKAAHERTRALGVRLGVSLYEPDRVPVCSAPGEIEVVQCPANVFDQRLLHAAAAGVLPPEVHVRSAFLQGLLLMSTADADKRLPAATAALQTWRRWCAEHSMSALTAALGFAKSLPARYCVLGVDTLEQFGQIAQAWVSAPTLRFPHLALKDPAIIDPRTWRIER